MSIKYIEYFLPIIKECGDKYKSKFGKYGESWKSMSIEELQQKLQEEMEEWGNSGTREEDYDELIDIINVSLMLAVRYKKTLLELKD